MRYQDFIGEVKTHVAEAQRIRAAGLTHKHPDFRRWRQRTESLVKEAGAHGYRLPGTFESANRFYTDPYVQTEAASRTALANDITDTENELSYLVDQFERYGVPSLIGSPSVAATGATAQAKLAVPERVTLHWLFKHVPVGGWAATGAAALALLLIGAALGKTEWFEALVGWFKTNWPG